MKFSLSSSLLSPELATELSEAQLLPFFEDFWVVFTCSVSALVFFMFPLVASGGGFFSGALFREVSFCTHLLAFAEVARLREDLKCHGPIMCTQLDSTL